MVKLYIILATQSIEARAQQEGYMYDWIVYQQRYKAKERKGERKIGSIVGSYKYLRRAAKALVISEPMATW